MGRGGAAETLAADHQGRVRLVGYNNFVRHNPMSEKFEVLDFHHIEFWCSDATTLYKRLAYGLGMTYVAKSDLSTGNCSCASYVLQSNDLVFTVTAPYSRKIDRSNDKCPVPKYSVSHAHEFLSNHGLGVRAVGIKVGDAEAAYEAATASGAVGVLEPTTLTDAATGTSSVVSELHLYGEVVLRMVSGNYKGPFLPNYEPVDSPKVSYGLRRLDHAVGNVNSICKQADYIMGFSGFHEFAEFTAEDVGTVDSGLNSMVLASNNELVLLPMNEPTFGTPRKSQIQTYLEQNEGEGLQHLALRSDDIFRTLREMRSRSDLGGMEFMPRPSEGYYRRLRDRIGDSLTDDQYREVEELGILVDKDDQGVLLQLFTKPLGDRPTIFLEIIQRVGCMTEVEDALTKLKRQEQAAGCGGFGKGNFSELFRSIEEFEKTLEI